MKHACTSQGTRYPIKLAACYFSLTWFIVFSGFQIPGNFKSPSFHNHSPHCQITGDQVEISPCCVCVGGMIRRCGIRNENSLSQLEHDDLGESKTNESALPENQQI